MPAPSRRSVLASLAALPTVGALGACTGGGTASRRTGKATRITFWSALRGSQEVVDAFNRTHDRIQVDFEQVPAGAQGGYAKLSNAARAGNAPDIATIEYPQLPGFAIDGVARDLTGMMSDKLRRALLPEALQLTTFDRKVFAVPLDVEPMVMHYRTDLFEQYGLEVPRTWDEFEETAEQVGRKAPGRRMALLPTNGMTNVAAFCWQAGGRWFDIDGDTWQLSLTDAPTRKVAGYWQRLYDRELVFMNAADSQRSTAQIARGEVVSRLTGAWDAGAQMNAQPGQRGKWRIAPLPQWDTERPVTGTHGGSTFVVTKDSQVPEAALEFIAWQVSHPDALRSRLSSGASSQYPAAPGLVPVGRKAFDRAYYSGQDIYRLFDEQARQIAPGWLWGPRMTATQKVVEDALARTAGGQGTVLDALRTGQRGTMPDLRAMGLNAVERTA
ncbi:extracellular solute-binding protein [Streptomyces triticagri]|uniref:Extracellular solute-binding protein n=1 Tax=Streptomyces triticagri TaxID=2293568 RepID=A0A372LXW2_9ACTN|nr:extracellular solute-binding protein [Streptomyces triticagri]RFU83492.1 extracellular solute-binding protein [Streptomyces triticagri]